MIGVDEDDDNEGFAIGEMLIDLIAEHEQALGIEIVRRKE